MKGLVLTLFVFSLLFVCGGILVILTRGFYAADMSTALAIGIGLVGLGLAPLSGVAVCLVIDEARRDVVASVRGDHKSP